jgi:hypothetical protein
VQVATVFVGVFCGFPITLQTYYFDGSGKNERPPVPRTASARMLISIGVPKGSASIDRRARPRHDPNLSVAQLSVWIDIPRNPNYSVFRPWVRDDYRKAKIGWRNSNEFRKPRGAGRVTPSRMRRYRAERSALPLLFF